MGNTMGERGGIMIGKCSINNCDNVKIHEDFEGLRDINICWACGKKIIEALREGEEE